MGEKGKASCTDTAFTLWGLKIEICLLFELAEGKFYHKQGTDYDYEERRTMGRERPDVARVESQAVCPRLVCLLHFLQTSLK